LWVRWWTFGFLHHGVSLADLSIMKIYPCYFLWSWNLIFRWYMHINIDVWK
jgi:hypothetical protein